MTGILRMKKEEYDDGKRVRRKINDEYSHKKGQVCYQVPHPFSLQRNGYIGKTDKCISI